jgi:hypothetical protein
MAWIKDGAHNANNFRVIDPDVKILFDSIVAAKH